MSHPTLSKGDIAAATDAIAAIVEQIETIYIGPRVVVETLVIALLARGHALVEGIPGVAKTTLMKSFAATMGCSFHRIQFTPDLLPSDITGTFVLAPREGRFELREGPIFAQVVMADEINRAPARTQSALLEAMQERQVTIEGHTRALPSPFIVLATQNPLAQAGTYPLPEAQLDRFLLRIRLDYPDRQEEKRILQRFSHAAPRIEPVVDAAGILAIQSMADSVHVADELLNYIVELAAYSRRHRHVQLGVSPRAALALLQAAKAAALVDGRDFVTPDDLQILAAPVWAHRLMLDPDAEVEGLSSTAVIDEALQRVPFR